ncbi:hypothetical protein ACFYWN_19425 [Streptomyces sp. NPDC002917]|uniref:hypothetical protein n=1 Tax=Streptomyces sp. NPDC002917 TaxID=3364671 RepID=UPI0036B8A92A
MPERLTTPFGARTTAEDILAGADLAGRQMLITEGRLLAGRGCRGSREGGVTVPFRAHPRCFNCHTKWWTENEARIKAEMSKAVKASASKAAALLDKVPCPASISAGTNRYGPQTWAAI